MNLALKNLCETFLQESQRALEIESERAAPGSEDICDLHAEKLKLFCVEDQQPVCVVCRVSKNHTNHRFRPINEAALDHKEDVQKSLKLSREKLVVFNTVKTNWEQTGEHLKAQAQHTEQQINKLFKKIRHFIQGEEETRVNALRMEERQKSQMIKEKINQLNKDIGQT